MPYATRFVEGKENAVQSQLQDGHRSRGPTKVMEHKQVAQPQRRAAYRGTHTLSWPARWGPSPRAGICKAEGECNYPLAHAESQ